jgi:hypothetical protein
MASFTLAFTKQMADLDSWIQLGWNQGRKMPP